METYDEAEARFCRAYLTEVMRRSGHVVSVAARLAGVNRTDMYRLLDKYTPGLPRKPKPQAWRKARRSYRGNAAWKGLDLPEARA